MRAWVLVACMACRVDFDERVDAGGVTDACTAIADLAAYFPMNAGDLVGTTLHDHSGMGHDGTIVGTPAPVLTAGPNGDALDFTATGTAYVDIASIPVSADSGAAITVSAWFEHAGPQPSEVLFDFPPPAIGPRYDLWMTAGMLCIHTENNDCWGLAGAFTDQWVHVTAIFRNGAETASELSIGGVAQMLGCTQATCDYTRTIMAPLRIGAEDTYAYHGLIDEVRVYSRALAADEIAALAAGTVCP